MKNRRIEIIRRLFATNTTGVILTADTTKTTLQNHDSIIVSILVVKDQGKSLLIKLREGTSWLAESGNILFFAFLRLLPLPFNYSKKHCASQLFGFI